MVRRATLPCLVLLLSPVLGPTDMAAQERTPAAEAPPPTTSPPAPSIAAPGPPPPRVLALTVSGGASLGAYQAGWLHVVVETAKRNPDILDLRLVTGASAGSINGLVAVMVDCTEPIDEPTESPFYRTWIDVGFEDLFLTDEVTPVSAFSTRALEAVARDLEARWDEGLDADCDAVFGVSTTRVEPRPIEVEENLLTLPRTEEKFVVRIRGRGPGRAVSVENYVTANPGVGVPLLPLGDRPFPALRALVLASAAFPVAFPPVRLPHCIHRAGDGATPRCEPADAVRDELFVDGGVFDNRPIRLAAFTAIHGLRPDPDRPGRMAWAEHPRQEPRSLPPNTFFAFLDPWVVAFPEVEARAPESATAGVLALAQRLFGSFVAASRTKEITTVLEELPSVRGRILPSHTRYPPISALLGGFFGFFERDFRELDFYLGMADAFEQLERRARPRLRAAGYEVDDLMTPMPFSEGVAGGRRFACVRATLDGDADARARCRGDDLRALRILLQVTVERLYDTCRRAAERSPPVPPPVAHPRCEAAQALRSPPRVVPASTADPSWRRRPNESGLDHALRRLAAYGFAFRDLGLSRSQAGHAPTRLRHRLEEAVRALADAQGDPGFLVDTAGRVVLNELAYAPPASLGHFVLGPTIDVGWSGTNPEGSVPWLRGTVALEILGLPTLLSSQDSFFGLAPLGGAEVEILPISDGTLQTRVGLRGGWLFSTEDGFGGRRCGEAARRSRATPCSRFLTEGYVALGIWERFRLQVAAFYGPPLRTDEAVFWAIRPGIGLQF